jgi:hypothetical protein
MRIDNRTPLASAKAPSNAAKGKGETFSVSTVKTTRNAPAGAMAGSVATGSLDALLALQEEIDPREKRRRQARRGQGLLEDLDRLKASLLAGRIPVAQLKTLAARLGERTQGSGDAGLDDLIRQIELRAQVELAKLGEFPPL